MSENGTELWLVLGVACVVGYFVVSKVIDAFNIGKDEEDYSPPPDKSEDDLIGGIDPNKPIG